MVNFSVGAGSVLRVRVRKFTPAAILCLLCTVALVAVSLRVPIGRGESVAVLFPPRTALVDAVASISRAGGIAERTGRWGNIIVASFPGRAVPVEALQSSGAWLIFNAIVAGGCDPITWHSDGYPSDQTARYAAKD